MPKNVVIIIVIILLLGGGAFFFFKNQNKMGDGGAITSIKDVLTRSVSMECEYTDEQGIKSKVYIKNGAVRSDYTGTSAEQSGSAIITSKKMYAWNGKTGFMMDIPEVTPGQQIDTEQNEPKQKKEFMEALEKYKQYCKNAVVSDSLFTPPADVNFQDFSQMMNQLAPTIGAGAGMSEGQVKDIMEQYNTNPQ